MINSVNTLYMQTSTGGLFTCYDIFEVPNIRLYSGEKNEGTIDCGQNETHQNGIEGGVPWNMLLSFTCE